MADSSEPAFLFLYRKGAVAPVDYLSTFATAPFETKAGSELFEVARILSAHRADKIRGQGVGL